MYILFTSQTKATQQLCFENFHSQVTQFKAVQALISIKHECEWVCVWLAAIYAAIYRSATMGSGGFD
jgi:hypothetical protein